MFKEDCIKIDVDYKKIILNINTKYLLKHIKSTFFKNNDLNILNILVWDNNTRIYIKDLYCPISQTKHVKSSGYLDYDNCKICYYFYGNYNFLGLLRLI